MTTNELKNSTMPIGTIPRATEITPSLKIVILVLGRGSRGKTLLMRYLIDLLRAQGRNVIVADGDRTNPTLRAFYSDAVSPTTPDDATVSAWTYRLLEKHALETGPVVLNFDFGGGDQTLKKIMFSMPLDDFLREDLGYRVIALHMVGSDLDDLAYVRDCEKDDRFAPAHTAVILNEAIIPEHVSFDEVYAAVDGSDVVKKITSRGGKLLSIPALAPAMDINELRLKFSDVLAGRTPLGPVARRLTRVWDEQMRASLAVVLDWLETT